MALPYPQSSIATGCNYDTSDGPGGSGSRFIAPNEDMSTTIGNRPHWALVLNDEYLDGIVATQQWAYAEVGVLTTFSGNSIDIDPSGGAGGDINYSGSLYLGESGWSNTQEVRDTLFQLLDENYNEVLVDGVEVKVSGVSGGNSIGDEFVTTFTTVNLDATLPSGNYRLSYGRGATLENLPQYALLQADVRGLQELAGEASAKNVTVCSVTGPADFTGASAITDALTALGSDTVLYVRSGSYTFSANLDISADNVTIIGESNDGTNGVDFDFSGGAYDLTLSGNYVELKNIYLDFTTSGGEGVNLSGDYCKLENCIVHNGLLTVTGDAHEIVNTEVTTNQPGTNIAVAITSATRLVVDRLKATAATGLALSLVTQVEGCISNSEFFSNGQITDTTTFATAKLRFNNCLFSNPSGSYTTAAVDLGMSGAPTGSEGIWLENCTIQIRACTRSSSVNPYVYFRGVSGNGIEIDADGWYQDDYMLEALYGKITNLKVNFGNSDPGLAGTAVLGAIHVSDGMTLENVDITSTLSGRWRSSIFLIGNTSSGSEETRAVVSGVKSVTGSSTYRNIDRGLLACMESYSTLQRAEWDDVSLYAGGGGDGPSHSVISAYDASNDVLGVKILNNDISVYDGGTNPADIQYIIYIECDSSGASVVGGGFEIVGNSIYAKPSVTSDVPDYMVDVIFIKGDDALSSDTSEDGGNKHGRLSENTIVFDATTHATGGYNAAPANTVVYLSSNVYMWRIQNNQITSILASTFDSGEQNFIWCTESDAGILQQIKGGGNSPTNNIIRNRGVAGTPSVGSPDKTGAGNHDSAFGDGSASLGNILIGPS